MIKGFPPVYDRDIEYLVLGSMPGAVSLEKKEYYGHKNNHFWKIMGKIPGCGDIAAYPYEEKLRALKRSHIGLWDVIASCIRTGSRDDRIKKPEVNDISGLLKKCSKIRVVFFNGRKAESVFREHFEAGGIDTEYLPSTSPLNTMKLAKKISIWKKAFEKYGFKKEVRAHWNVPRKTVGSQYVKKF